jgi:SAM-dependent methyltransferase
MSERKTDLPVPERPEPWIEGLVPTLNNRGFMSETLDYFSEKFSDYAGGIDAQVLDVGCAYGIASRAALEKGARVLACDMDAGHVQILERETPPALRERLRTDVGVLPHLDYPDGSFGAVLCSRVLHFLLPDEIRATLEKMHRWVVPGGRIFLIADTPYTGFWFGTAPEYERRKADGQEWPGYIDDIATLLDSGQVPDGMLPYLNPLDPDILARECSRAGFKVEEARFTGRGAEPDGRHHAGCIAIRA